MPAAADGAKLSVADCGAALQKGDENMRLAERTPLASGRLAVLALAAGIFAAGPASADPFPETDSPSDYPLPPIGTKVVYTDGYTMAVVDTWPSVAGVTVISEHPDYGVERITHAFGFEWYGWTLLEDGEVVDSSWYIFNTALVSAAWPLTPGFEAHYYTMEIVPADAYDPIRVVTTTLEVLDVEHLDTPAGRLPAMEVRLTLDFGPDEMGTQSTNVLSRWFHPDFGLPLRGEDTYIYGADEPDTYVFDLVSISFPDG